jgi:transcription factor-like protein
VPDLAPVQTWKLNFHFGFDDWLGFDLATRHLYISVVALHRAVQRSPCLLDDKRSSTLDSHEMTMVHHHQACAARLLSDNISTVSTSRPNQQLLRSIHMFLSSHIQQGAYTPWRSHLNGAHGLLALWGPKACMGDGDFVYFMLMMTNVFGTTTTPSHLITEEIILQHRFYLEIIDDLEVDFMSSLTPVPPALVKAVAKINMLRAAWGHGGNPSPREPNPAEMLSSLEQFSCAGWAETGTCENSVLSVQSSPSVQQDSWSRSWEMLIRSFRDAAILYLIISTSGRRNSSTDSLQAIRRTTHHALRQSIDWLFEAKLTGGTHHKFIIWPMVIAGVEAVYAGDERHLKSLQHRLQGVTRDLGTLAMRDAAGFLGNLWDRSHDNALGNTSYQCWDEIFSESPLFLM